LRPTEIIGQIIRDESGQDLIEYGLLALFISIVALVTIKVIGPLIVPLYQGVLDALQP
jgi:Flp pilus assembly pilin Flp